MDILSSGQLLLDFALLTSAIDHYFPEVSSAFSAHEDSNTEFFPPLCAHQILAGNYFAKNFESDKTCMHSLKVMSKLMKYVSTQAIIFKN